MVLLIRIAGKSHISIENGHSGVRCIEKWLRREFSKCLGNILVSTKLFLHRKTKC